MEHSSTSFDRQECRDCGSHTHGDHCGCCQSRDLAPVHTQLGRNRPRRAGGLQGTRPALLPFTRWLP